MVSEKKDITKISGKNWLVIVVLGLAGQIAWNVENSWFNTFVFDTITPDPKPIAWMVAVSAITATLTTLIIGTASDRIGKRKPFILYGYILWGMSTALFPATAFIKNISLAILAVVIVDAIMTFFGSMAYDAAYNAWTTDISDKTNRGLLSGVISIFPLIAALIGAGLSGIVIDKLGYNKFFYILGIIVGLMGIIGGLLLRDSPSLKQKEKSGKRNFAMDIINVFSLNSIKRNKELFLIFISLALFSIGIQVFLPFQIIYLNNYLNISKSTVGLISAIAVLVSILAAIPAGKLADKGYITKFAFISPFLLCIGLVLFSFSRGIFTLIITGSLQYTALVIFTLSIGAWMKNLMPEDSRGKFEGVRMIFNVAIPMVIGPAIGSSLVINFGIPTVLNGEAGFIPTPIIFPVAGVLCITSIYPLIIIMRDRRRKGFINNEDRGMINHGG
ncbi:MAG TPA: MFS transporter [Clostridia bacterium]|nr:MFS transporter [Clostridia bacterium]